MAASLRVGKRRRNRRRGTDDPPASSPCVRAGGTQWGLTSEYRAHILSAYPFTTLTPSNVRLDPALQPSTNGPPPTAFRMLPVRLRTCRDSRAYHEPSGVGGHMQV